MLIGAGQWHYLAFNQVKRLEEQNGVLTIAERIEEGLWQDEDCASTNNLADVLDCIKYYRSEGDYQTAVVHRALKLVDEQAKKKKMAKLLKLRSDLQHYLRLNERDLVVQRAQNVSLAQSKIQKLQKNLAQNPSDSASILELARQYNSLAFNSIFIHQPAQAIDAELKAIQLNKKLTVSYTNLALGYLYQGNWPAAEKTYREWMNKSYAGSGGSTRYKTFKEAFLGDLKELEDAGITHPDLPKARALLEGKKQ